MEKVDASKLLTSGGIVGKILFTFLIVFLCLFGWMVVQNTIMSNELIRQNKNVERLINEQTEIRVFKQCVLEEYTQAMNEYNDGFINSLGKFMNDNSITFPQAINISIQKFRKRAEKIKDCLIFPVD